MTHMGTLYESNRYWLTWSNGQKYKSNSFSKSRFCCIIKNVPKVLNMWHPGMTYEMQILQIIGLHQLYAWLNMGPVDQSEARLNLKSGRGYWLRFQVQLQPSRETATDADTSLFYIQCSNCSHWDWHKADFCATFKVLCSKRSQWFRNRFHLFRNSAWSHSIRAGLKMKLAD